MNFDQLRYFIEAAKFEHFGKASKSLGISRSAISHAILALEEELGRSLFMRKGKFIYLNHHGKTLSERAGKLLHELDGLKEVIASEDLELQGHFRIAATHFVSNRFLAPVWAKIQSENTKLTSEVFSLRSADVLSGALSGEIDFGVCLSPQTHSEIESKTIHKSQMRIVVAKNHAILKLPSKERLASISKYPAVLPRAFHGIEVCEKSHPAFRKFRIEPYVNCMIDSYEIGVEMVSNTQSWGFFPAWMLHQYSDRITAIALPKDWNAPVTVTAVWRRDRPLGRALRLLLQRMEKQQLCISQNPKIHVPGSKSQTCD